VREQSQPGDIVVCLGAGTISAWANARCPSGSRQASAGPGIGDHRRGVDGWGWRRVSCAMSCADRRVPLGVRLGRDRDAADAAADGARDRAAARGAALILWIGAGTWLPLLGTGRRWASPAFVSMFRNPLRYFLDGGRPRARPPGASWPPGPGRAMTTSLALACLWVVVACVIAMLPSRATTGRRPGR
jgi:hypothetical protein